MQFISNFRHRTEWVCERNLTESSFAVVYTSRDKNKHVAWQECLNSDLNLNKLLLSIDLWAVVNRQNLVKERCGGEHWVVRHCLCSFLLLGTCRNTHILICSPTPWSRITMQVTISPTDLSTGISSCLNGTPIDILQLYFGVLCINYVDLYMTYCKINLYDFIHIQYFIS